MNIKLKASLVFEKDGEKYCITDKGNNELRCKDKDKGEGKEKLISSHKQKCDQSL